MNFKIQFLVAFISSLYLIIFVDMIFILIGGETYIHINSIILSYIQHLTFPIFKRTMKAFISRVHTFYYNAFFWNPIPLL